MVEGVASSPVKPAIAEEKPRPETDEAKPETDASRAEKPEVAGSQSDRKEPSKEQKPPSADTTPEAAKVLQPKERPETDFPALPGQKSSAPPVEKPSKLPERPSTPPSSDPSFAERDQKIQGLQTTLEKDLQGRLGQAREERERRVKTLRDQIAQWQKQPRGDGDAQAITGFR